MNEVASAIMDAAERRIRNGGFNGFSFREIAADVGVKSSSVHYHFPTKEALAAAVVHRYTDRVAAFVRDQIAAGKDPVTVWTHLFRSSLQSNQGMCLGGILGAAACDLPSEAAAEVRRFFTTCLEMIEDAGVPRNSATQLLAKLEGAMLVANALGDISAFDRAISELPLPDGFTDAVIAPQGPV
jgi:TetR/AcrR family transcriptional regulator, transcriptional repressor for nem operon